MNRRRSLLLLTVTITANVVFWDDATAAPKKSSGRTPKAVRPASSPSIEAGTLIPVTNVTNAPVYTPAEQIELDRLPELVKSLNDRAVEYREAVKKVIGQRYDQRKLAIDRRYEAMVEVFEERQRRERDLAMERIESFVATYPDDEHYTPDALFRLSELYFERSYDQYIQAQHAFELSMMEWNPNDGKPEPIEPSFHYEPTIAVMQRLVIEFPKYALLDGALYLLGYCLSEQGEDDNANVAFESLVARLPNSRFASEVWTRIGEYYFNSNVLDKALVAYQHVMSNVDSPFYDKAIYKSAWTHYRMGDATTAPHEFQAAVDNFVQLLEFNEKSKSKGEERGADLRSESIQYIAIIYADENWGGLDRLQAYLKRRNQRLYDREILLSLADVYFDQTRFQDAIAAYRAVNAAFPLNSDAPDTQERIIAAFERNRDFENAALERQTLNVTYAVGTAWYEHNKKDDVALRRAAKLTEKSLYAAAVFFHKQAQAYKETKKLDFAKQAYERAALAYASYLQRFPHDKQFLELTYNFAECLYYSLSFEQAAQYYMRVRDSDGDPKVREEAAFSVVLSYENAIKAAELNGSTTPMMLQKSTDRPAGVMPTPLAIEPLRQKFIEASDKYAQDWSSDPKVPKILYKAAEVVYAHNNFTEARERFRSIVDRFPSDEVAGFALNLIIETYLANFDYAAVEEYCRIMLSKDNVPGGAKMRAALLKFKNGAMFKIAEETANQGNYEKAAELYLRLVNDNPNTPFLDSALNNAAVAYEKVNRFDSASKLYERIGKERPNSPLADGALFRVGLNAERFFNFEKAVEAYMAVGTRYPKSQKRADAIYNAALAYENTQEYDDAAEQYQRYCKLFGERPDAPQVCFRSGLVYEKMGEYRRAVAVYENFIHTYKNRPAYRDSMLEAQLRVAKGYEVINRSIDAVKFYQAVVKEYRVHPDNKSAPFAAEAQFQLVEREFENFKELKIDGDTKQQKKALTSKAEALKKLSERYQEILRFKQIDWTLAALFRIGQLYQDFAENLINASCPADVRKSAKAMGLTADEVCDEYRVLLEEKAASIEDKAVQAFEKVIQKGRELQVANRWTKDTLIALNQLRRSDWPLQKEAKTFVDETVWVAPKMMNAQGVFVDDTVFAPTPSSASRETLVNPEPVATPDVLENAPTDPGNAPGEGS